MLSKFNLRNLIYFLVINLSSKIYNYVLMNVRKIIIKMIVLESVRIAINKMESVQEEIKLKVAYWKDFS